MVIDIKNNIAYVGGVETQKLYRCDIDTNDRTLKNCVVQDGARTGLAAYRGITKSPLVSTFYTAFYLSNPSYIESYPVLSDNSFSTMDKQLSTNNYRYHELAVSWDHRKLYASLLSQASGYANARIVSCDIAGGGKLVNCDTYSNVDMAAGTHFFSIAYNNILITVTALLLNLWTTVTLMKQVRL